MIGTKIDLHGFTAHVAWQHFRQATKNAYFKNYKTITVITGHGMMSKEIEGWCEADPYVVSCKRQNPNTGSWSITIKPSKNKEPIKQPVDLTGLYKKWNKR